jgi:hypothetical protein
MTDKPDGKRSRRLLFSALMVVVAFGYPLSAPVGFWVSGKIDPDCGRFFNAVYEFYHPLLWVTARIDVKFNTHLTAALSDWETILL